MRAGVVEERKKLLERRRELAAKRERLLREIRELDRELLESVCVEVVIKPYSGGVYVQGFVFGVLREMGEAGASVDEVMWIGEKHGVSLSRNSVATLLARDCKREDGVCMFVGGRYQLRGEG